jgi:hypothetical protein
MVVNVVAVLFEIFGVQIVLVGGSWGKNASYSSTGVRYLGALLLPEDFQGLSV